MIEVPSWLKDLAINFKKHDESLFVVGGAIRETLLNREIGEWDLTTSAIPTLTLQILRGSKAKDINIVGEKYGTVAGKINNELVEITTYRGEYYASESRKPVVEFGKNIEDDLSRRDFTINAIAFDLINNKLIDLYNGQEDLTNKIVRAVGEPNQRFEEDPLRMLRAIRFAVVLDFEIEKHTLEAIEENKGRLAILSKERIAQELNKILLAKTPSKGIRLLEKTGLLELIIPEMEPAINLEFDPKEHKDVYNHILQVLDNTPPKLELRLTAIFHDISKPQTREKIGDEYHFYNHEIKGARVAKEVLNRLKYPNDIIDNVVKLVKQHQRIPSYDNTWSDGGVRRFVRDAGDLLDDLFIFAKADLTSRNQQKIDLYTKSREELYHRYEELEKQAEIAKIKSPLSGEELMKIFSKEPGPWIKPIKDHLLDLVLEGKLGQDDKDEAEKIAKIVFEQSEKV